MSEGFKQAQDRWCESLLSDESLCDGVAYVGAERRRVPFVRALLATLSTPLKAALYGEFREGCTHELVLKDVSVEAFDVMLRSAYHLDPKLTPKRAMHGLKAAKVYMIEDLERYCWDYLNDLEGLDCARILQALTESIKLSFELPEHLLLTYGSSILAKSVDVLKSPSFIEAHGTVIASLIKLDEFHVKEETLWTRLVEWSKRAVRNPELLGPFAPASWADACQSPKRAKPDADDFNALAPNELAQQEAVLRLISPHMRFVQMEKCFFVDKVRPHLDRESIDAVTDYLWLGRESKGLMMKPRVALQDPVVVQDPVVQNYIELFQSKRRKLKFQQSLWVSKVELDITPGAQNLLPTWSVSVGSIKFENAVHANGQSTIAVNHLCDQIILEITCRTESVLNAISQAIVYGSQLKPTETFHPAVQSLSQSLLM